MSGNIPKQVQHEHYRQVLVQGTNVRHGKEIVVVTAMHEELGSVQPPDPRLVMDIDLVFTLSGAEELIATLQTHIDQARASVEVVPKGDDTPQKRR